jgi:hypothetical protein
VIIRSLQPVSIAQFAKILLRKLRAVSAAFAAKIIYCVRGGALVQGIVLSKGIQADQSHGVALKCRKEWQTVAPAAQILIGVIWRHVD